MNLRNIQSWLRNSMWGVTVAVLIVGYLAAAWGGYTAAQNKNESLQARSDRAASAISNAISKELISYQEILRGGGALFSSNQHTVNQPQWKLFVDAYDINNSHPGLNSLGFAEKVPSYQLTTHVANMRQSGINAYEVSPDYQRSVYYPVVFVEPTDRGAPLGSDLSVDDDRNKAMEKALSENRTIMTNSVYLLQSEKPGFVIFQPVYTADATVQGGQRATGFTFATVQNDTFFDNIQQQIDIPGIEFAVNIVDRSSQTTLHATDKFDLSKQRPVTKTLDALGQSWNIAVIPSSDALTLRERNQPLIIFAIGTFLATLFAIFVLYATHLRSKEISYRKQLEVQEAKDDLISLASHQLRTPATVVKQYVGMVLEGYTGRISAAQRDVLQKAYDSNDRQLEIVNQILHISRIESGRLSLNYRELDLTKLIKEVISEQRPNARKKKQQIKSCIPRPHSTLEADPTYIRMVIENLLSNAIKYTHEKGLIKISLEDHDAVVIIEVQDSGVGIAKEDIRKLFQKFSRVHNELSVASGGTGIGLYLARLIVELHDGSISVSSEKNKGSVFRVTLPKYHAPNSSKVSIEG